MLPPVIVLFVVGYFVYLRKLPTKTGMEITVTKKEAAIGLPKHIWSLVLIMVMIIIPFAWMILLSFKTNTEIMNSPLSLPDKLNLDNFKMAFRILPLGTVYSEHVFSIRLLEDEESEEYTDIIFNPREGTYYAPMEESSLLDSVDKRPILGYFPRSGDGAVHIDILLDSSVAEIYINKESCMHVLLIFICLR